MTLCFECKKVSYYFVMKVSLTVSLETQQSVDNALELRNVNQRVV